MSDLPPLNNDEQLSLHDDGELPFAYESEKPKKRPPRWWRKTYISLPLLIAVCLLLVCSAVLLLATSLSNGSVLCRITPWCPMVSSTRLPDPTRSHNPVPPQNQSGIVNYGVFDPLTNSQTVIATTATPARYAVARCPSTADERYDLLFTMEQSVNAEIFLIGADGGNLCRVTDNLIEEGMPDWSPDRTRILFTATRSDSIGTDLYTMNLDGSNIVNLTQDQAIETRGVWSRDGNRIAFRSDRDGHAQIYIMNADGSGVQNLTPDAINAQTPSWSPDGTQIAYMAGSDGDPNKFEIFVVDVNTRVSRRLTDDTTTQYSPVWSPLGDSLVLYANLMRLDQYQGTGIFTLDLSDNSMLRVTDTSHDHYPAWSPDGKSVAFVSDSTLTILDLETMQTRALPTGFKVRSTSSWRE